MGVQRHIPLAVGELSGACSGCVAVRRGIGIGGHRVRSFGFCWGRVLPQEGVGGIKAARATKGAAESGDRGSKGRVAQ